MGELYEQFIKRDDLSIYKWHHYFPIYERYFAPFRGKAPRMLEIGIGNGGSSRLFAEWLGKGAHITGVDIDPRCTAFSVPGRIEILTGDQADKVFLEELAKAHGPWDIVLDDGGHTDGQIITSFEQLFPKLNDGGVYLIEDTHAHWWEDKYRDHPGGLNVVSLVAELFSKMHGWTGRRDLFPRWHLPPGGRQGRQPAHYLTEHVAAVHLFDSVIVIEKRLREEPFTERRLAGEPRATAYRIRTEPGRG